MPRRIAVVKCGSGDVERFVNAEILHLESQGHTVIAVSHAGLPGEPETRVRYATEGTVVSSVLYEVKN